MKKILLTLVAMFAIVGMATAKNPVSVTSGSLTALKDSKAKIFVVYDYSNETLNGKSVEEFVAKKKDRSVEKIQEERKNAEKQFADVMGQVSENGLTVVSNKKSANYVLTFHFGDFKYGNAAASALIGFGAGDAHMSATATLTDKAGKTVAELQIKKLAIDGMDKKADIRSWGYMILAHDFDKAVKKSK